MIAFINFGMAVSKPITAFFSIADADMLSHFQTPEQHEHLQSGCNLRFQDACITTLNLHFGMIGVLSSVVSVFRAALDLRL